jgi:sulfatase modifying factor 1
MKMPYKFAVLFLLAIALFLGVLALRSRLDSLPSASIPVPRMPREHGMILIPAGAFVMGSNTAPDARPEHDVEISAFWIDEHEVTNRQFAEFVAETRYLTTAEQVGEGYVFQAEQNIWNAVPGADWRHPTGPSSTITGRDAEPVVQVSWFDALAYAQWAGKRLPTEAEWEYSARGGLADAVYPWGTFEKESGRCQANYWQGRFPYANLTEDGFAFRAPVGSFPANGYELYDMAGNVWEWCDDWYAPETYSRALRRDPRGPDVGAERIRRGGSWASAVHADHGIAVFVRGHAPPQFHDDQTGFRCARHVSVSR